MNKKTSTPLIPFKEALKNVLQNAVAFGDEVVNLMRSTGRVLAEDCTADRDFPPFNRSTKDGVALIYTKDKKQQSFEIETLISAGMPTKPLSSSKYCAEIMTGAVVPANADTVIMYEHLKIKNGHAELLKQPTFGQNIHKKGSDILAGEVIVKSGVLITPAVMGVLASVGKNEVLVKKLPEIGVISTGDELVEITRVPLPHQIRKSNALMLASALQAVHISPELYHLADERSNIKSNVERVLSKNDVLLISGGVSMGKFDFIPEILSDLGFEKKFHRVAQRPGKPFWFGVNKKTQKVVFSFPGNPVSTFTNYYLYFIPWLSKSLGLSHVEQTVILESNIKPHQTLTLFIQVSTAWFEGKLYARTIQGNGSGDLIGLTKADGLVCVPPGTKQLQIGTVLRYIPCT